MLLRLEEEKRVKLEAMYLRLELLQRVKDTLEREEVTADLASVRPIFENFQLKGLEVPEKSLRESRKELENSGE